MGTVIVLLIVCGISFFAYRSLRKQKGCAGCCNACSGCAHQDNRSK